jgi:hypothetical protein
MAENLEFEEIERANPEGKENFDPLPNATSFSANVSKSLANLKKPQSAFNLFI